MITKDTAAKIAFAYQEIEAAENLLKEMKEARNRRIAPDFRDSFGRIPRGLQLGVPSGENSHQLFNVSYDLGEVIVKAHLEAKRAEIAALCQLAKGELEAQS